MTRPVPLMVTTSMLLGWTSGRPYSTQIMQLRSVATYGTGEYCSTDLFFQMRMNVGLDVFRRILICVCKLIRIVYVRTCVLTNHEGMDSYTGERKSTRAVPLPARCREKKIHK